ncbi:MAG: beta-ketoacyl synthase N-terminal-like domain-containing protein [Chloroflexi bacterium]|nr:beta-ketoacyl synthase N-terminal-like domain-containing protein [Chloroflexota bacterium]MCZ6706612.1 beta-ketoacyl synthase N-terminal-like domain-containing protein [Chloroflexota bacterium]
MENVYVAGVGMIKFGRYPEETIATLGAQAVSLALKDAEIPLQTVEMMAAGNLYQTNMVGQSILKEIGMTGIPVYNVANACATGSTAFREAYYAVGSGAYDVALAVGVEQMGKQGLLGGTGGSDPAYITEGVVGTGTMPGVFGMAGMEHMRKYGTKIEHFAQISVKNHEHAMGNPLSQYQVRVSLEDVLNARMVAYPNTLYMCCPTGDGAAASVLMSEKAIKKYSSGERIRVAASAMTTDPYTDRNLVFPDINTMVQKAADLAYAEAGLGPQDLDSVELHDCFATAELLHYENLRLCDEGEGGRMVEEKLTDLSGPRDRKDWVAVNTSGGLLSKGHPLGATGVANICELVWQMRGQAGERQVEGHKAGLAHVIGLGSAATVHILTK